MIIREDPPFSPKGGRRPSEKWKAIAEKLKADPGNWYKIVEDSTSHQAATDINGGRYAAFRPRGTFEATSRKNSDRITCTVWARYVGEEP